MSFWTFSDVFEENGPLPKPFVGNFGLRAKDGINKPSFYGFQLLHRLGEQRIANASRDAIVTVRKDGTLAVALWNVVDPGKTGGVKKIRLAFENVPANARVAISRVDEKSGNTLAAYRAMGSPQYPTEAQVEKLNNASKPAAPEESHLQGNTLDLELGANALVLVEVAKR